MYNKLGPILLGKYFFSFAKRRQIHLGIFVNFHKVNKDFLFRNPMEHEKKNKKNKNIYSPNKK